MILAIVDPIPPGVDPPRPLVVVDGGSTPGPPGRAGTAENNSGVVTDAPSGNGGSSPTVAWDLRPGEAATDIGIAGRHASGAYVHQRVTVYGAGTGKVYQVMAGPDAVGEVPDTELLSINYGGVLQTSKFVVISGSYTDFDVGDPNYRRTYTLASPWFAMLSVFADGDNCVDLRSTEVLYRGFSEGGGADGHLRVAMLTDGSLYWGNVNPAAGATDTWAEAKAAFDLKLVRSGTGGLFLDTLDPGTDGPPHLVLGKNGYISALDPGDVERVILQFDSDTTRLGRTNQGGHTYVHAGTGNYIVLDQNFLKPMSANAATLTSGDTTAGLVGVCSDDALGQMLAWADGAKFRRAFDGGEVGSAKKGNTAARPTNPIVGQMYLDTTLAAAGKPIWFAGSATWVDATGAVV